MIDTGVDWSHPDLSSSIWANSGEIAGNSRDDDGNGYVDDIYGWDFAGDDNSPWDVNGHGTHVAGTIAAARNGTGATGVAYDATIMPVKVLGSDGSGSLFDVAAGIRYAVDNGADVINLSLGGGGFTQMLRSALAYADRQGVFVAAAAGNESAAVPGYPARYSAQLSNVLSVGAHDRRNQIASFSNRVGPSGAVQVDAPGVSVYSTLSSRRYARFSGTSMASPHVAGLAALTLSASPNLTPSQVRTLIVEGSNRSVSGSDSSEGINAAMTVARAVSTQTNVLAASSGPHPGAPGSSQPIAISGIVEMELGAVTVPLDSAPFEMKGLGHAEPGSEIAVDTTFAATDASTLSFLIRSESADSLDAVVSLLARDRLNGRTPSGGEGLKLSQIVEQVFSEDALQVDVPEAGIDGLG